MTFIVGTGGGEAGGVVQKSIAAGGTLTLTAEEAAAEILELTGSAASHVLLQFTGQSKKLRIIRNLSTDNAKYVLLDDGGAGIVLPPNASRVVGIGTDGAMFAADGRGLSFELQATIAGGAVGNNDATLLALPTGWLIDSFYSYVKVVPTDGTSIVKESIGVSDSSIMNDTPATGAALSARGIDTATDYGSAMTTYGVVLTPSAKVITHRHAVTVATSAGMVLAITITGRRLA